MVAPAQFEAERTRLLVWIALSIAAIVCYLVFLNAVPDFFPEQQNDPFSYISLAKSLAADKGYPTKHWFPGFPAMLAVLLSIGGLNFTVLKLAMVATSSLLALSCYAYFRNLVGCSAARYLSLLAAVVPVIFEYSHKLMAEIPALAFAMLALASIETLRTTNAPGSAARWTVTLAFACAAAVLMRGNSLALIPAVLITLAMKNSTPAYRWRLVTGLAAAVAVFGLWMVRNSRVEFSGIDNVTYLQEVRAVDIPALWKTGGIGPGTRTAGTREMAARIYQNVVWYQAYNVADALIPGAGDLRNVNLPGLGLCLALLIASPTAIGFQELFRSSPAGATYLLGSLALMLIYPTGGASRMLVASIPMIVLAAYLGIKKIGGVELAKGWALAAACVGLISCAVAGHRQRNHPYSFDGFAAVLTLLGDASRLDAGIQSLVSDYPQVVAALTPLRADNLAGAGETVRTGEARAFLVLDGGPSSTAPRLALASDLRASVVSARGDFRLWRVELARQK